MPRKSSITEAVDKEVGSRVHQLRISKGMSRQQLAERIGVTHQQLQKYEKATNRISVGRLTTIATALNKPISYFFDEVVMENITGHLRLVIELSRNCQKVTNFEQLNAVNIMVKSLIKK